MSWASKIAHDHGLQGAAFITQPLAVCLIYCHYSRSLRINPGICLSIPGMPPLGLRDLPSYINQPESIPLFLEM
ncbi:hypothetical protein AMTR_s01680p00007890 [Amborella trichopoda]|uniref:Uncharacterized protein n=1 Tax=Amborella trichopoda TaxID=13333 RepID=W1P689_AMBTC|nr:hypothetical protein AMTR_s01680p00007890 [Amborella trichopoda]